MFGLLLVLLQSLVSATRSRRSLLLENAALRQQLVVALGSHGRPRLRATDRAFWVLLRRGWSGWRDALVIVRPATVVRGHRHGFRLYWHWKSRRRWLGRPRVAAELRELVRQMARENTGWGAPRIHGELLKFGFEISERTVSRLMPRSTRPPSQSWRTFLTNHVGELTSIDFFVVPTMTFRLVYVLVILRHARRRVVHVNVTESPTAEWTAQQIVNAFPWDTAPRYLLRDRDAIYGDVFKSRVAGLGIQLVATAPRSPWQNPYVERFIGSVRRECFDHVVVLGADHAKRLLQRYLEYYERSRTHLSLAKDAPVARAVHRADGGEVVAIPRVGGLHHGYERLAA